MHTVRSVEIVRLEEYKSMHERAYSWVWMSSPMFYVSLHSSLCVSRSLCFCFIVWVFCDMFYPRTNCTQRILRHTHVQYIHSHPPPSIFCSFLLLLHGFSVSPCCIATCLCLVSGSSSEYWHLSARLLHNVSACTWNIELGHITPPLFD